MISTKNIIPITTAKRELMKLLKKVQSGDPFVITRDGRAAGVLMSAEEYEGLVETLEILSDKKLLKALKRAEDDFRKGRSYSHKEVFEE